ncbi:MAG: C4-dicarboxylic acid transporter DauA [Myxococcales bacterium]|nr:C4-dicarboxylic acid transporter DauA [Myxococcales bacterium]MCB9707442.1 C4-dicarboxylic acid transporter DauA [Myxococcales bacterium]
MARTRYRTDKKPPSFKELPASALRAVIREGYSGVDLKADLLAGVVVGIVALPLAMALAIGVGVAPHYGLYTAIIAGFFVAALGGSRTQVTGPTAAFIVILSPLYAKFGMAGLLISGFMGGVILIVMGLFRLGGLIQYIPHPVTTGFTAGIATVIATLQIKDLLGLTLHRNPEHFLQKVAVMFEARGTFSIWEPLIGLMTLAILLYSPRIMTRVPAPLVALPAAAILSIVLDQLIPGFQVATIATRFHTNVGGHIFHGIPQLPPLPLIPWLMPSADGRAFALSFDTFRALLSGAFAVAMLGAIESLLSAVVADGMARTKHDPDSELISLGIGNLIVPFFGGIPATGAIARTATNIKAGARSPLAAMAHALTILAAVLALAPLLGYLPMTSLAALLLLVAWNMSEAKHFMHMLRVAPKSDVAVLLTCYGLTVGFDMVVGVTVGMVLAAFLFMRRMAEVTHTRLASSDHPDLPGPVPPGVIVYEISGPLFFGAAQKAMATLEIVAGQTKAVILLMDQVHAMDATGLVALESALQPLRTHKCLTILCGVREQPMTLIKKAYIEGREGVVLCASPKEALAVAAAHKSERPSAP